MVETYEVDLSDGTRDVHINFTLNPTEPIAGSLDGGLDLDDDFLMAIAVICIAPTFGKRLSIRCTLLRNGKKLTDLANTGLDIELELLNDSEALLTAASDESRRGDGGSQGHSSGSKDREDSRETHCD